MYSTVLTCTVLSHDDADSCEAAALFSCTKCTVLQCTSTDLYFAVTWGADCCEAAALFSCTKCTVLQCTSTDLYFAVTWCADSCEAAALFSCTKCTVLQCTPLYRPAVQTGFRVMQQLYLAVRKSTAMY